MNEEALELYNGLDRDTPYEVISPIIQFNLLLRSEAQQLLIYVKSGYGFTTLYQPLYPSLEYYDLLKGVRPTG